MHPRRYILLLLVLLSASARAQSDSVDVTFRYVPAGSPSLVHLAGEFNNWANNSGGVITPNPKWTMDKQADGSWTKTLRLNIGGGTGTAGAYQYKYNENGSSGGWLADPSNPRTFSSFGNSIIAVRAPTVFPLLPKDGSVLATATPVLRAGVFPSVGASIDTALSMVLVDGVAVARFGAAYDPSTRLLAVTLPALGDGERVLTVRAVESGGRSAVDSTRVTVKAAPLQWLSRSNPKVYDSTATVRGIATDAAITSIRIVRNGVDTIIATSNGASFSAVLPLREGDNVLRAIGSKDASVVTTDNLVLHRLVDHTPRPAIGWGYTPGGKTIFLHTLATTDPDGGLLTQMRFNWVSEDSLNPVPLNLDSQNPTLDITKPAMPGEYFLRLSATDPEGHTGTARNYFTVHEDGSVTFGTTDDNPRWVRDAIVYEIFVPAFSAGGTLRDLTARIPSIVSLGVNTLWLMPIMDNRGTINEFNGGFDIIDLYNVDESLGTLADFRDLVAAAHAAGLRVVLDITPNHVSSEHPWLADIRRWKDESIYRPFIETRVLGGDRGLGQTVASEGGYPLYARYSNWALPNLNLSNRGTREEMLDVFRYWVRELKADGYRMDVYWGPQNRYGSNGWWRPFREAIKTVKPEILVLGETDGTGSGSEANYAGKGGAMDAGYDWNWYGQIKNTMSSGDVAALHTRTSNYSPTADYNYYSGNASHYLRFLENHDETRIAGVAGGNLQRTMPAATVLLTAPGIPMIYAGQEIGWQGQRNKINFADTTNAALRRHYERLIAIRKALPTLRLPAIRQLVNSSSGVYTYLRPGLDANVICAANFSTSAATVVANVDETLLQLSAALRTDRTYFMNDLLNRVSFSVTKGTLPAFAFPLAASQSRVFLLADSAAFPLATGAAEPPEAPGRFEIGSLYPNPIHASARRELSLSYTVPAAAGAGMEVALAFCDASGRELLAVENSFRAPGTHVATLRLPDAAATARGTYFLRLAARDLRSGAVTRAYRPVAVLP